MIESQTDPWLVLRTKSRHENIVESVLLQKKVTAYLPKHKVIRSWQGRRRVVELPLFPGYVFVRPRIEQYVDMRYIRGSCGFICIGNEPAKMSEKDLETVRTLIGSGSTLFVDSGLAIGKRIKIADGPLMGVEGELVQIKNQNILIINVDLLNSSVRVEVDRELIYAL